MVEMGLNQNEDAAFNDDWVDSPLHTHTLVNNQTWEEAICQWQKNMELVPSKGGGKTEYYSKVHAGNKNKQIRKSLQRTFHPQNAH
jgi:hypothetical protein